ncbi:acyl-CoA C20 Delta5-desaturase-like [Papaver somniferum]|uniref:acyl-CoA C20 Delta5-desaturase-like n=1 Tax=Papaver somniferum TaxID=3469 RepID=UPI000E6FAD48|nr:acyl-CoA C20 Delta5-desaturase-like [Papaver somniferum]
MANRRMWLKINLPKMAKVRTSNATLCIALVRKLQHLQKQAYYRFLEKTYYLHLVGLALLLYTVEGLSHLIWGMDVRTTLGYHFTFVVNSMCHTWGESHGKPTTYPGKIGW